MGKGPGRCPGCFYVNLSQTKNHLRGRKLDRENVSIRSSSGEFFLKKLMIDGAGVKGWGGILSGAILSTYFSCFIKQL